LNLNNRVAVITGAGSGIGRAMALALARRGCHLALADIDVAGAETTAEQARVQGVRASVHRLDVADGAAVAGLPAQVLAQHGQVDLLFNNAGVAVGGRFEQVREEDFDWLMQINFYGVVRMTRAFLPLLRQSDDARIVNISSLFGLIAPGGQTAYTASKFAVRGFSNALLHELEKTTVGVTVVHPGGVSTSIARSARAPAGAAPEEVERHRRATEKQLRMPPEKAGELIVRAVLRRQVRVIIGADAKFLALLERLMPVHYWSVLRRMMG
jgi:NAD(P)-dependent dehydrogenase (short-subunit alcohol dehydrogenase family)